MEAIAAAAATTTAATAMPNDDSNKENVAPNKGEEKNSNTNNKRKNPIPLIAPSFKKKRNKKTKRVPLADITHLFRMNSAPLTTTTQSHEGNGVPAISPSDSVLLLHSNSRRRTTAVVLGSKTLRMGFR